MSYAVIHGIMDAHLKPIAEALGIPVAWEGVAFKGGPPFMAPALLLGTPRQAGLGGDAPDFVRGIYQVNVVAAPGTGWGEAASIAESLRQHFSRKRLTDAGVSCGAQVEAIEIGPAMNANAVFTLPVSVRFWAFTDN